MESDIFIEVELAMTRAAVMIEATNQDSTAANQNSRMISLIRDAGL
jgi:hypothetical protein